METLEPLIDQIPIRHDLTSSLMFMSVFLGYFLTLVIFLRAKKGSPIVIFGWGLLVQSIVCTDTYLCYTGLIKYVLFLNDSTEPLVLLIPTTIYFFVYALMERKPITFKKNWWHFLLPVVYAISQIGYYASPLAVKLNAYLGAYYRNLTFAQIPESYDYSYHIVKDQFRWLLIFNFTFYILLLVRLIFKKSKSLGKSTRFIKVDKYTFTKNTLFVLIIFLALLFLVYINYEDDGGDHFIVIGQGLVTLITLFFILSESRFFENSWLADKYETLTTNSIEIENIEKALHKEGYFLTGKVTLKSLSEKLNVNQNTLSKVINSETGMNFNDYLNQKRVNEAKNRLLSQNYGHLTIEAVGNSVGFNSKSAFYTAFKKHVQSSPSAFVKKNKA